jgi:D-methionine transport system ATP-binding protein
MTALYEFRNITFQVPPRNGTAGPLTILTDVSFTIERGMMAVITGPSGSGKSTLLRLFNRLADPTSGEIFFEAKNIMDQPITELRRRIGWVPQIPVRFPGSVEANLRLPFTLSKEHKYTPEQIEESVEEMKSLDLIPRDVFSREASDLSVGEAQRMNLLRALATKPDVMLLDEPTSALDPDAADGLLTQVARIREQRSLTVVMVSHRPDELAKVSGTVFRVEQGRLVTRG